MVEHQKRSPWPKNTMPPYLEEMPRLLGGKDLENHPILHSLPITLDFKESHLQPLDLRLMLMRAQDVKDLGDIALIKADFHLNSLGFPSPYHHEIDMGDIWVAHLRNFIGHVEVYSLNIKQRTPIKGWGLFLLEGTDYFDYWQNRMGIPDYNGEHFNHLLGWVSDKELHVLERHSEKAWELVEESNGAL